MKIKYVRASALVALMCGVAAPALAGGLSEPIVTTAPTPVPVAPQVAYSDDWSGFYVGAFAGFAKGEAEMTHRQGVNGELNFGGDGATYDHSGNDGFAGLALGYGRQFSNIVVGAELTYSTGVDIDDDDDFVQFSDTRTSGAISDIYGLNLRLGYDAGAFQPYVTAGLARANLETNSSFQQNEVDRRSFSASEEVDGVRYGFGALYNLTDSTFVGAEVARTDFDEVTYVGDDSLGDSASFSGDFSTTTVAVTVGLRF